MQGYREVQQAETREEPGGREWAGKVQHFDVEARPLAQYSAAMLQQESQTRERHDEGNVAVFPPKGRPPGPWYGRAQAVQRVTHGHHDANVQGRLHKLLDG